MFHAPITLHGACILKKEEISLIFYYNNIESAIIALAFLTQCIRYFRIAYFLGHYW